MIIINKKVVHEVRECFNTIQIEYLPQVIVTYNPLTTTWDTKFINVSKRSEIMKMLQKGHKALQKSLNKGFHPEWIKNNIQEEQLQKEDKNVRKTDRKKADG